LPNKNIQTWEATNSSKETEIKISVEAIYIENVLTSAEVAFYDYTYNPKGVTSKLVYVVATGGKMNVPKPPSIDKSPPEADSNFTIDGWIKMQLGVNKINMLVLIDLSYGKPSDEEHEEGSILEISVTEASK